MQRQTLMCRLLLFLQLQLNSRGRLRILQSAVLKYMELIKNQLLYNQNTCARTQVRNQEYKDDKYTLNHFMIISA